MAAKEKWLAGDVKAARAVLNSAFVANPQNEDIWLAAVKLESENGEFERAGILLSKARENSGTARVWMKSALLERQLANRATTLPEQKQKHDLAQLKLLEEALTKFPEFDKLWIMLGQLHTYSSSLNDIEKAKEAYRQGTKNCPMSTALWLCYAHLEAHITHNYSKARSILETARLKIPKTPALWLAAVRVEQSAKNDKVAQQLMAKALQECPTAGILWAHAIVTDSPPQRKSRSFDALKRCNDDPYVSMAVARLFWMDRKIKKAREWFNRAVTVDPDLGDAWIFFYKFELQYGTPEEQTALLKRCTDAVPHHGELWIRFSKDYRLPSSLDTQTILQKASVVIKEPFNVVDE